MKPKYLYKQALLGDTYAELAERCGLSYSAVRSRVQRFYQSNNLPSPAIFSELNQRDKNHVMAQLGDDPEDYSLPPAHTRISSNGEREIQKILDLAPEELGDKLYLLAQLGLSPDEWDIKEASLSEWGSVDRPMTSVRVRVTPAVESIDYGQFFGALAELSIPKTGMPKKFVDEFMEEEESLVIPLFDLHLQETDRERMERIFEEIEWIIHVGAYKNIHIIFGGDGLEHDNFVSTTEFGTRIDDTDIQADYEFLYQSLYNIIYESLQSSNNVSFTYLRGNHSPSLDWAISHALKQTFESDCGVTFDIDKDNLIKAKKLENVFIGMFHGHKSPKKDSFVTQFITKFPQEWADAEYRIIYSGHLHSELEVIKDLGSAVHHQQPSPKKLNLWADQNNFVSHFVGVKLYLFSASALKEVYYIQGE